MNLALLTTVFGGLFGGAVAPPPSTEAPQPVQVPSEVAIPAALAPLEVPVSIELTRTHFLARSHAPNGALAASWVVFENGDLRLVEVGRVDSVGRLAYDVHEDALEGMTVRVVSRTDDGRLVKSGAMRCVDLVGRTVFFVESGAGLAGWVPTHGGRSLSKIRTVACAAPHVPVPLPTESTTRSKERPIEGRKLPPV